MPPLGQLRCVPYASAKTSVARLAALGRTMAVRRKMDRARQTLAEWRARCERPLVSVSGGKDSTLLLLLARAIDPGIPAMRADGPVGLSDRDGHVTRLAQAAGGQWIVVPYHYDVAGVLAGDVPYPHASGLTSPSGSKVRELIDAATLHRADGMALGLRASESRGRLWNAATRGTLYETGGRWVCTPLVWWTADEVVGALMAADRLPLNPVYTRTWLQPDLEHLRDGTWMPNQTADAHGYRAWLQWHYPEHVIDYDRAVLVLRGGR